MYITIQWTSKHCDHILISTAMHLINRYACTTEDNLNYVHQLIVSQYPYKGCHHICSRHTGQLIDKHILSLMWLTYSEKSKERARTHDEQLHPRKASGQMSTADEPKMETRAQMDIYWTRLQGLRDTQEEGWPQLEIRRTEEEGSESERLGKGKSKQRKTQCDTHKGSLQDHQQQASHPTDLTQKGQRDGARAIGQRRHKFG